MSVANRTERDDIIAKDVYDASGRYLGCIADLYEDDQGVVNAILALRSPQGEELVEAPWSAVQGYDSEFNGYVVELIA